MSDSKELVQDLTRLDADAARAWTALTAWRDALASDPEGNAFVDPLASFRHIAGKATFDELGRAEESVDPMGAQFRAGLRRFVAHFTEARLLRDLDIAIARACADTRGPEGTTVVRPSWRDSWRGIVTATSRKDAVEHLDAAVERAPALVSLVTERAARRTEIARRLGLADERTLFPPLARAGSELARQWLDASQPLADAVVKDARRRDEALSLATPSLADTARMALARDANEGWPAHLSARWLIDLFGSALAPAVGEELIALPAESLPRALGGASFARALERFGTAFRRAAATRARTLPFALRDNPWFVDAHRVGGAFASLVGSRAFHKRALGLSERAADHQTRTLARTLLLDLRARAMRTLFADASPVPRDRWEEITTRVVHARAPRPLAGAWPHTRDDESSRFVGALTAHALARELTKLHDEDWFKNPRAGAWLATRGATVAHDQEQTAGDGVDGVEAARAEIPRLTRIFEEALG